MIRYALKTLYFLHWSGFALIRTRSRSTAFAQVTISRSRKIEVPHLWTSPPPSVFGLAVLILLAFGASGHAEDAPMARDPHEITWGVYDVAPFMMTEGPDKDRGIFDQVRQFLDDRLDGYSHRTLIAPFVRIVNEVKRGAQWCFIGGIKTPEREEIASFSLPIGLFYPLDVVINTSQASRFAALGPLRLEQLLNAKDLRTAQLANRSLGPEIDAVFKRHQPVPSYTEFEEAFKMLAANRLDYLIEFSAIASTLGHKIAPSGQLTILPLQDIQHPIWSRVMCPKTEWGARVVERINMILRQERPSPAYRAIVESWSDQPSVEAIRAIYQSMFLTAE